jgi:purine-binding chemotaxis protein CheW
MSEEMQDGTEKLLGKYLTFVLGNGEYAIEILKVQQVIQIQQVTRLPRAPKFIRGLINLRGKVIPVLSIHDKFNMSAVEETKKTCIVIVEISNGQNHLTVGVVIDEIKEVMQVTEKMLTDTPDIGMSKSAKHIVGAVRIDGKVRFILDLDEVLSLDEISELKKTF